MHMTFFFSKRLIFAFGRRVFNVMLRGILNMIILAVCDDKKIEDRLKVEDF